MFYLMSSRNRGGGCKGCKRLRGENRVLREKLSELQDRLERLESSARRSGWYKPSVKPVGECRRPGRKKKHAGGGRSRPERVDEVREVTAKKCPVCESGLGKSFGVRSRFVWDVPPPSKVKVTEYRVHRYWCRSCRRNVEKPVREALPGFRLGVGVYSWVYVMHHQLNVSYDKIMWWMREVWNLDVTKSGLTQGLDSLACRLKPVYDGMVADVRDSPYCHVDETGMRVAGENQWTWVYRTPEAVVYHTTPTRGSVNPQQILGDDYQGVLVSDNYSSYNPLTCSKQKCWVHVIRKARDHYEYFKTTEHKRLYHQLQRIYHDIKEYQRKPPPPRERRRHYRRFKNRLERLAGKKYKCGLCKQLANEIGKRTPEYLTCILKPHVPPHNNPAEQSLRSRVIHRKNSSTRTQKTSTTHDILTTLQATQQQKQNNPLQATKQILSQITTTN